MEPEEKFFRPPSSSQIIGALSEALQSKEEDLTGRTGRHYREGRHVGSESEKGIVDALARALVRSGLMPHTPDLEDLGLPVLDLLASTIRWHVHRWDNLAGSQRGFSMPVRAGDLMALAYLRLIVVDLAFRTAAICWLTGLSVPDEQPPLWARKDGRGLYLRMLMKRIGSRRLSAKGRNGLAEQVDVWPQTVDGWLYKGVRPSNAHIEGIAGVLAKYLEDRHAQTLAADLHRHYTLCTLADLLADHMGRLRIEDIASALVRFSSRLLTGLRAANDLPHPETAKTQMAIAIEGITGPLPHTLVGWVRAQEEDSAWRGDLVTAVYKDWGRWLYDFATELTVADEATRFAQQEHGVSVKDPGQLLGMVAHRLRETSGQVPPPPPWAVDRDDPHHQALSYHDRAMDRAQVDQLDNAIHLMSKAVDLNPESGWYHVKLAELLADVGRLEEGISEFWIADGLEPNWEQPRVMIGLVLNKAGRFEEAKEHLEATARHMAKKTINLGLNLGMAYLGCSEPQKALKELERVLTEKPDQGLAMDLAARCHFLQANHVKGWRKAKEARKLGYAATYDDATAGVFRKGRAPHS